MAYGGERAFDDIRRAQMLPVLGREVVEGEQRVAILDQALDRLLVFDASVLDEGVSKAASEDPALLGLRDGIVTSPALLLGCWCGLYDGGVFEGGTRDYDSVAFRFMTANGHPDHDTIATLASEMGLLKLGDGRRREHGVTPHHW